MAPQFPSVVNVVAGPRPISAEIAETIASAVKAMVATAATDWLAPGKAFDIPFDGDPDAARAALRTAGDQFHVDANIVPLKNRRKKLLIADMDSTIIGCECIDELADVVGIK